MRIITAGRSRQYQTLVSDEDYDHLQQWLWTFAVSHKGGELIYIRRSIRVGESNVTILMHHVVLERMADDGLIKPKRSKRHTAHHGDGNALNNQRWNLTWRTPKQQMAVQRGLIRYRQELAAHDPMASIPF
jgi:hypothetical protein